MIPQTSSLHLLKPYHQHTVRHPPGDHRPRQIQPCRPRRAIVVDIIYGDTRHAELVEHTLPAGAIAVDIARHALVNVIVIDLGVEEGFDAGFETEFGVLDFASGFDEFGEADAENVGVAFGSLRHGDS